METIRELVQPLIALLGFVIACLIYRLNVETRKDNWAKTLREFHQFFWTDSDLKNVREWIASDVAYEEIKPVLILRHQEKDIDAKSYEVLDKIDKFAALLLAFKRLLPKKIMREEVLKKLFDDYWLGSITTNKRPELRAYILKYFQELEPGLGP